MPELRFTPDLITEVLVGKTSRSAPGSDGVHYGMLRAGGNVLRKYLCIAFNLILDGERPIPSAWSDIRVRMVPKGKNKDPKLWSSFRPISISSCIGKLFNGVIERVMSKHLISNGLLDTDIQKGFLRRISGVTDHIQALWHCATHSTRSNPLHVLLVDLASAFNTVPHHKLWALLAHYKVHPPVISYLVRLYGQSTMHIKTKEFQTCNVPVQQGVLQGDTLSPLLFITYFTLVINAASNDDQGFRAPSGFSDGEKNRHHLKAFADDLTVLDNTAEGVRATWSKLKQGLDFAELRVNVSKCVHAVIIGGTPNKSDTFTLDADTTVPSGADHLTPFLGLDYPMAARTGTGTDGKLKAFLTATLKGYLTTLDTANYPAKAKVFFYKVGVLSRLRWYFLIYEKISYSIANSLQAIAMSHIKHWYNASSHSSPLLLTSETRGLGIESITLLWQKARAVHIAAGLAAKDPVVRGCFRHRATTQTNWNKHDIEHMRELTTASIPTKKAIIERCQDRVTAEEIASSSGPKPHGAAWLWLLKDNDSLEVWRDFLRKTLNGRELSAALNIISGGASLWTHIYAKAKPTVVGSNERRDPKCTLCGGKSAHLPHILSYCNNERAKARMAYRHNLVVQTLLVEVLQRAGLPNITEVYADLGPTPALVSNRISGWITRTDNVDEALRPDIVIRYRDTDDRTCLLILEVACPFESEENLRNAYLNKLQKYIAIPVALTREGRNPRFHKVDYFPILIGCRGYVPQTTVKALLEIFAATGPECRKTAIRVAAKCARSSMAGSVQIVKHARIKHFNPIPGPASFPYQLVDAAINLPRDLLGDRSVNLRLDPDDGPHPEVEVCDLDLHVPDAN